MTLWTIRRTNWVDLGILTRPLSRMVFKFRLCAKSGRLITIRCRSHQSIENKWFDQAGKNGWSTSTCSRTGDCTSNQRINQSVDRQAECQSVDRLYVVHTVVRKRVLFLQSGAIRVFWIQTKHQVPVTWWLLCGRTKTRPFSQLLRSYQRRKFSFDLTSELTDFVWRWFSLSTFILRDVVLHSRCLHLFSPRNPEKSRLDDHSFILIAILFKMNGIFSEQ